VLLIMSLYSVVIQVERHSLFFELVQAAFQGYSRTAIPRQPMDSYRGVSK